MNVLQWFFSIITQWYVWVPITVILLYLAWRNTKQVEAIKSIDSTLLSLEIPRSNDKKEPTAEQLFASLHGILRDAKELKLNDGMQEHLSFEIISVGGKIRFLIWTPKNLQGFVEGQLYAQYPDIQVTATTEDYVSHERQHSIVYTSEVTLTGNEFLPIKTYSEFDADPLAGITNTLSKLENTKDEIWIQLLVRPVGNDWQRAAENWGGSANMSSPLALINSGGFNLRWFAGLFEALWKPPQQGSGTRTTSQDTAIADAVAKKAGKLGYQAKIRIAVLSNNQSNARLKMQSIVSTFKQFNQTGLNGFKMVNDSFNKEDLGRYKVRLFSDRGYLLNIEELASIFHLPHTAAAAPNISWAGSKTAEPPASLPVISGDQTIDQHISAFGMTNFRGLNHQFGILRQDRSRHMYIIGHTGAGKTGTLELLALSDIFHKQGYAIIDPHGDFAINNLKFIPASRLNDVVYFNPADTEHPLGFNPLEITDPNQKSIVSSELIGVFKRMFGDSWGPRLEYILRYTILALLDRPDPTLLDITRMLTDKEFREETLVYCTDAVVLQFWRVEFASWSDRFQTEAIAPVLNKVGAFTANPIIRNIVGQPKSSFNIREIMDSGKILVVNLSKGLIGEDNAAVLGAFVITKIQLAAMSRSDIPNIEDRRPFYLYVDEFQNFATDSFATILSEARKYGLNLTVANQYISQMNEAVRDAVFGNVGTIMSFRVSPDDSTSLVKQFAPTFEANDLLQLHNRDFVINMVIDGEKQPAFSGRTLNLPPEQTSLLTQIIAEARQKYSRPKAEVEAEIREKVLLRPVEVTPAPALTPLVQAAPPVFDREEHTQAPSASTIPTHPRKRRSRSRRKKQTNSASDGSLFIRH
ncbi:MAG TPA: type IV secretion system DNA-binding domain-containing protein [Candidatus Saccharibacteria bacterium]|nr:type IV secretion system DNA-binding domain-containing protein [Candidatus Saccharibacteria bacterium]HMR38039.1 type IV secretion system DNA-binding domain-containing protein [Candidatus Saccharibacteria bacterium]